MTSATCTGTVGPRVPPLRPAVRACWGVRCTTMPWWSWRPGSAAGNEAEADEQGTVRSTVRVGVPAQREPSRVAVPADPSRTEEPEQVAPVTLARIGKALDLL